MGYYTSYQSTLSGSIFCDQTQLICGNPAEQLTRTACIEIHPVDCGTGGCSGLVINNGLILCAEDQTWNCNLCANDLEYYNPVKIDDTLSFQFQQLDDMNHIRWLPTFTYGWDTPIRACNVFMKDCCTGDILEVGGVPKSVVDYCTNYYVGEFCNPIQSNAAQTWYVPIQAIEIPITSAMMNDFHAQFPNSNCFYFQFEFYFGGTTTTFYTEPYRIENCKDTLIIESKYRKLDCNKYYYGDITNHTGLPIAGTNWIGTPFQYSNAIRIPAYIELKSFTEKKDFFGNLNFTKSSQLIQNYKFTTNRIPIKLAILLANILAGEVVYIGNGEFYSEGEITKNNDSGNQWFMEADLKRTNCTTTFTCN